VCQGRGVPFLIAKMRQNSIDDVLVLDAPVRRPDNDPHGTTATTANLDIDIENSLESLGPGHGGMLFSGCAGFRIGASHPTVSAPGRRDQSAPAMV
jgi:hypothetical protein